MLCAESAASACKLPSAEGQGALVSNFQKSLLRKPNPTTEHCPLDLLAANPFFPLVVAEKGADLHRAIVEEQIASLQQQIKAAQKKRGKRSQNKKLRLISFCDVAPQFAGPCVSKYLEEIGCELPGSDFMSTAELAKAALLRSDWPLWFGQRFVASVGGYAIYATHVATVASPGMCRLTIKSLPYLRKLVAKWRGPNDKLFDKQGQRHQGK